MRHLSPNLSINTKILLLLLSAVLLVLLLVGVIFSVQVTQLYEGTAKAALRSSAELLHKDLLAKSQHLIESSAHAAQDKNILAALNLIENYQNRENYEAKVFDPEKRRLFAVLDEMLHVGGFNQAAVYQADGSLVAFAALTAEGNAGGYTTYAEQGQALLKSLHATDSASLVSRYRDGLYPLVREPKQREPVVSFRVAGVQQSVGLQSTVPFLLQHGSGSEKVLGWLTLSYHLDQDYLDFMGQKLGVKIALKLAANAHPDGAGAMSFEDVPEMEVPALQLEPGAPTRVALVAMQGGYQAQVALEIEELAHAYLLLDEGTSELTANLDIFSRSIAWVLLLTALVVIPLGVYLTSRWINRPLQLLTTVARGITKGEAPKISGFTDHDELGTLAEAFVVMSSAIMNRENELREKQRQIAGIIGNAPAVIYIKDHEGRYQLINSLYEQLFSVTNEQMRGKTDSTLFEPEVAAVIRSNEEMVFATQQPIQVEEVIPQGGEWHTYLSIKFPLFDDESNVVAVCGISTDITERKRTENDLLLAKNIIQNASEGVVVTNLDGVITDINEAYERITGYSRDEVIGMTPAMNQSGRHDEAFYQQMWQRIDADGFWQGEIWDRRKNGELYPKWLSINTVRDEEGQPSHYVGIFSDITRKKATEEQLERLAYFDALTQLPNRTLFRDRLGQEISTARRHQGKVALLFLDLDRFKQVNDNLGHPAGDKLLQHVAQLLRQCVRESDTVSRLGGDEFTVIIPEIDTADQASGVAQKIINELARPLQLYGHEVHVGTSVGIAIFPDDGSDIDTLSRHADMALYKAKELGRNTFQFFSRELQQHIAERIAMEEDLRKALVADEFSVAYQPKYCVASGKVTGMEALVRWQHPKRGMVSPTEFIPLSEETGLIMEIGEYVLRQACMQTAAWRQDSGQPLRVAVNLSARQFQAPRLMETIKLILDESGLPAEALELELTESMVVDDVEQAIATMRRLRDLGLSLAIDDFGTGYSSLSYLKRFPINTLKIDQSFVRDLSVDSDDASIVQAIIAMGRQLDLHVVAEGVETEEQLAFLRKHGCGEVQGYFMSRPLSSDTFLQQMEQ